jgi:predicted RNA-binding Zn-ribbon protein involved in translation (DUF1610 family)
MVTEKDTTLRCLNCFVRLKVPEKVNRLKCHSCGVEYVITWRGNQAKIAGTARK